MMHNLDIANLCHIHTAGNVHKFSDVELFQSPDSDPCKLQVRGQRKDEEDSPDHLISLRRIITAAESDPDILAHVPPTLAKSADAQNVPIVEALVQSYPLQAALVKSGHAVDAVFLKVISHAHQAWDTPHLTHEARSTRLQNLRCLIRHVLRHQLYDVHKMATFASRQTKIGGLTTELLFVMMANIEAREQLLKAHPDLAALLAEIACGTDDLEAEFGMLVRGCGFKPTFEVAFAFQQRCDFLFHVRRNPHLYGLSIPKSTKCHYSYHDAMTLKDTSWNDGEFLLNAPAYEKHLNRRLERAKNVLGLKRDATLRSIAKSR